MHICIKQKKKENKVNTLEHGICDYVPVSLTTGDSSYVGNKKI